MLRLKESVVDVPLDNLCLTDINSPRSKCSAVSNWFRILCTNILSKSSKSCKRYDKNFWAYFFLGQSVYIDI